MSAPRRRRPRVHPPARFSGRVYVRLPRPAIARFRFLLEARDNLGLFTAAEAESGLLMVRFSPHQRREMRDFLDSVRAELGLELVFEPEV
ncbi:MAG: DUF4911 domain-containing protein [Desulfovibrionaceae bacterium]|nr:DUF4911 domain-containing protein [Desulfovibrionaceae bacterium]MDD4951749.1 DUF4911 domain-containing protein [Desulfovibrionaceae bacterium]